MVTQTGGFTAMRTVDKVLDTEPFFIKTGAEILDTVRQIFPNARVVREPVHFAAKECLICGKVYYGRSEDESQYCSNECAAVGHRRYKNPRKTRIRSLRDQCRASGRRASERVAPESFETWLRNFEKRIEQMPSSASKTKPSRTGRQSSRQ